LLLQHLWLLLLPLILQLLLLPLILQLLLLLRLLGLRRRRVGCSRCCWPCCS
jgi:hypothetical protein